MSFNTFNKGFRTLVGRGQAANSTFQGFVLCNAAGCAALFDLSSAGRCRSVVFLSPHRYSASGGSKMSQGLPNYQLKKVSDVADTAAMQAGEQNGDAEFVFPRTTVCGRFNIKEKIGSGGFGAIYKGTVVDFIRVSILDFHQPVFHSA